MILKISAFVALSSLIFSCNNSANETPVAKEETALESEHHHDESEAIELNNGEKWTVDKDMLVHIRNMEKDVASFTKSTDKDYAALSKKLLANIDLLTSNCTMTGKAHDELHKWLLPYIDLVGELEAAENEEKSAELFDDIQIAFTEFNFYFN